MDIKEFMAGTIGGGLGTFISHPLDTIRVLAQSKSKVDISLITKEIYSKGGLRGFYKGLSPPLLGISIEKALVFGTFYNLQKYNYFDSKMIDGFIAGFVSTLVVTPMERFKIALQTGNSIKSVNYRTLFRGWNATIFRESPGYAIYFKTYEALKKNNDTKISTFIKGCISGASAWVFIYPSDYVKTRVQNEGTTYKSFINNVYKNHGLIGFYRGFSLALLRCIPLHGGVFLGYETCKSLIER